MCLYALDPESPAGFLGLCGALRPAAPLPGGGARPSGCPLLCASLSPCGGPLQGCAALAYGAEVSVTALPRGGGAGLLGAAGGPPPSAAHKAHWRAAPSSHGAAVTAVAAWSSAPLLLTGASDGALCAWDLRTRPAQPHPAAVAKAGAGPVLCVKAAGSALVRN